MLLTVVAQEARGGEVELEPLDQTQLVRMCLCFMIRVVSKHGKDSRTKSKKPEMMKIITWL